MRKILFVLLVLAGVFTAGCITSPQIPEGCGLSKTDDECEASITPVSTPADSTLVVKSEQVQATPMPTEAMVAEPKELEQIKGILPPGAKIVYGDYGSGLGYYICYCTEKNGKEIPDERSFFTPQEYLKYLERINGMQPTSVP